MRVLLLIILIGCYARAVMTSGDGSIGNPSIAMLTSITTNQSQIKHSENFIDRSPNGRRSAFIVPVAEREPDNSFSWEPVVAKAERIRTFFLASVYTASAIDVFLFLLIVATVISSAPFKSLKKQFGIFAWVAVPSLVPLLLYYTGNLFSFLYADVASLVLVAWTVGFAAIGIGTLLRIDIVGPERSADFFSLPFAVVVLTMISCGFAAIILIYWPIIVAFVCDECNQIRHEGLVIFAFTVNATILFGALLPPNSNLIRAYDLLTSRMQFRYCSEPLPPILTDGPIEEPDVPVFHRPKSANRVDHQTDRNAIKQAVKTKREQFDL